jgi:hypothetical protein
MTIKEFENVRANWMRRLSSWLTALGRDVEIIVKSAPRKLRPGRLRVIKAA